jgi:hypothetical protein
VSLPEDRYDPARDVDYITRLLSLGAYQKYFVPRIEGKIAELEERICSGETTAETFDKDRALLAQLKEILRMPEEDLAAARRLGGDQV